VTVELLGVWNGSLNFVTLNSNHLLCYCT